MGLEAEAFLGKLGRRPSASAVSIDGLLNNAENQWFITKYTPFLSSHERVRRRLAAPINGLKPERSSPTPSGSLPAALAASQRISLPRNYEDMGLLRMYRTTESVERTSY
jgi:hypothetical protein